jgi:hypothetical protein
MIYYLRILSFDVALGAVAMAYWAARLSGVALSWQVYAVLASTVAFIYTADHLYDAYRIGHRAHTARHRFHQRYFRVLLLWALFLLFLSGGLSLALSWPLWQAGALLAGIVALHFVLAYYLPAFGLHKELRIAVLYAAGLCLPAWVQGGEPTVLLLYTLAVGLWAYCNLLTISYFEYESDLQDGHFSVVQLWGKARSRLYWGACLTASVIMVLCIGFCLHLFWADAMVLAAINVIYLSIYFFKDFFAAQERYRHWADGALLLPWALVFA